MSEDRQPFDERDPRSDQYQSQQAETIRHWELHSLDQDRYAPAPEVSPDVVRRVTATSTLRGLVTEVEQAVDFLRDIESPVAEATRVRLEIALRRPQEVLSEARYWI